MTRPAQTPHPALGATFSRMQEKEAPPLPHSPSGDGRLSTPYAGERWGDGKTHTGNP